MEVDEKTQDRTTQIRGTQGCKENYSFKKKQLRRLGGESEPTRDNSTGFNRSDWSGRDPFGLVGGETINQLISSFQSDIKESEAIIERHQDKIKKTKEQIEALENIKKYQQEAAQKGGFTDLRTEEE